MGAYLGTSFRRISGSFLGFALILAALLTGSVCGAEPPASGEETENARRAMDIARTTMSPFCPGRTLDGCPSPKAGEWRADIREWVDQGLSRQEIQKRLQARVPKKDLSGDPNFGLGVGFAAAAFVTALGLLVLILKRLSAPAPAVGATSAVPSVDTPESDSDNSQDDSALEARLEDELRDTE